MAWLILVTLFVSGRTGAQDFLSRARDLYETAAYEEALQILDDSNAEQTGASVNEQQAAGEYRALCLMALDRQPEAARAVERIVRANPWYRRTEDEAPPRFVAMVDQVRSAVLPPLVRQWYSTGKIAVDEKRYEEAIATLTRVLQIVDDPTLEDTTVKALGDVIPLAAKFLEASRQAVDLRRRSDQQRAAPTTSPEKQIYTIDDAGVIPPVAVQQKLPDPLPFGRTLPSAFEGELELIIGPTGTVRSATVTRPIHPEYDRMLLKAAQKWTYRPATRGGRPVSYRRVITIQLSTSPDAN